MSDALIRTEDLWKTYEMGSEKIHALHSVTFEIHANELVAIMGPSGSGKSGFHNVFHRLWKVAIPTSLERNGPNPTTPFAALQTLSQSFFAETLAGFQKEDLFLYSTVVYIPNPETDLKGITLFSRAITDSASGARTESPGLQKRSPRATAYVSFLSV